MSVRRPVEKLARAPDGPALTAVAEGERRLAGHQVAVGNFMPPKAIGEVKYLDRALVEAECTTSAPPSTRPRRLRRAVPDRAVARHHRAAMLNEHYRARTPTWRRSRALRVEYETIVQRASAPARLPGLALERHLSYADKPLKDFQGFVDASSPRSMSRCRTSARARAACTCAGATTRGRTKGRAAARHPADLDQSQGRRLRAARSPTRATPTKRAISRARWPTTRSSSPA